MSDAMYVVCMMLCLLNGFLAGMVFSQHRTQVESAKPAKLEPDSFSEEEIEAMRKEREAFKEQQKAFLDMMGYNADIAYGVNENPLEGG